MSHTPDTASAASDDLHAMSYRYGSGFMDYTARRSAYSAQRIIFLIRGAVEVSSVLDVGCARGTWLREWRATGAEIQGVDGAYVNPEEFVIDHGRFRAADLSAGFDLGCEFDLVQSLEVAEHLPSSASVEFVHSLVRHSRGLILFSAAPPGQGGENHINEQPYEYWRELFRTHGYRAVDWLRPQIAGEARIAFWYRYNAILYATGGALSKLPPHVCACALSDDMPIADVSPMLFRARKAIVRALPQSAQMRFARLKARLA